MNTKIEIKLLTYGMVTMSSERSKDVVFWRQSCWTYSEKQDSLFWEIWGISYCSFIEDGIPKLERVGKKSFQKSDKMFVVYLNAEEMVFIKTSKTYEKNEEGLEKAKEDFKNGMLFGMFLTDDEYFI